MSQLNLEARFEASKADYEPPHQCVDDTLKSADGVPLYVGFSRGNNFISLDGNFTVETLEEILTFMRNHT